MVAADQSRNWGSNIPEQFGCQRLAVRRAVSIEDLLRRAVAQWSRRAESGWPVSAPSAEWAAVSGLALTDVWSFDRFSDRRPASHPTVSLSCESAFGRPESPVVSGPVWEIGWLAIAWIFELGTLLLTGMFAVEIVVPVKATLADGALIPSITISFVTKDWRKSGRLFCELQIGKES